MANQRLSAATLIIVAFMGLLALMLLDVFRSSIDGSISEAELPEIAFAIFICFCALPAILLAASPGMIATYGALIVSGLLALVHGLHIFEHLASSDWAGMAMIIVTMFAPTLMATIFLWRVRKEAA